MKSLPPHRLQNAGLPGHVAGVKEAETTQVCSDGTCKIIEWGDSQKAAAVISSYAAPLLEGCGTIKKGDLRVVAKQPSAIHNGLYIGSRGSSHSGKGSEGAACYG